ncbi:MAG: GHKL domain-containing protein [Acidobacteria bacterium]|nr:GHKL domain-containing protein [Acidobacteriota bacterium]
MNLRLKFILYLVITHVLFGLIAIYLIRQRSLWLFAFEAIFVISLGIGIKLVSDLFGTLELINTGAQFIHDGDFTARLVEVGQPEMDHLVNIYNRMIDHLREERTRAQEQNYFLDKLLSASPAGILTLDFDGQVALANPSSKQLLQLPDANLLGQKLSESSSPFLNELHALNVGESKVIPWIGRRRVKCQKSHFLDRGFPRHFVLMEELTEELRQTEKSAYEKLIRLMSHEVNNTVGAANSLLHSCLHYSDQVKVEDRHDFETAINVVITRTNQLGAFMKGFAEVVKLPEPKFQPCNLQQMLADLAHLYKAEAAQRQIEIVWDVQSPLSEIDADRVQMEQVFLNLLKNALEAIDERGRITLRTGKQNGREFVMIEDTGCGLSPEVREHLFTPFFSTKEHGQGIGLTMVQEILDAHHFDFALESEPEQPTRFTIWFQ